MTRILFALALGAGVAAIGCTGIHPVGPMAGMAGPGPKGTPGKDKKSDEPPEPVTVPAPRPTPPLNTVGPEDVTAENPYLVLEKVQQELAADRQTIPQAPVTAEISKYKGGVKQN